MKWSNLKQNKCPKCFKLLTFSRDKKMIMCDLHCKFVISAERMNQIVMDMNKSRFDRPMTEEESLEALNNWGHDEIDNYEGVE